MRSRLETLKRVLRGEVAPRVDTAHTVLAERPHFRLLRYGSDAQLAAARDAGAVPVLLVPPLAVPPSCYDLAPGTEPKNSVVEFLLASGTIPYVVDFGDMGFADRDLGFEEFFDHLVPDAITGAVGDFASGSDAVDLLAWSLGGTLSFLTAAAHPELPIRSIIAIGTPLDYKKVPPYPLVRALMLPTGGEPFATLASVVGFPAPTVRFFYRATAWQRELRKPHFILRNLHDEDALARMEVIDRFQNAMPGYPGRVSKQMLQQLIVRDEIARGVLHFGDRTLDLSSLAMPIQLFGSHRDAIVSHAAAKHGEELFRSSPYVEFHTVETSHLGLLSGATAAAETWPAVAAFRTRLDAARL